MGTLVSFIYFQHVIMNPSPESLFDPRNGSDFERPGTAMVHCEESGFFEVANIMRGLLIPSNPSIEVFSTLYVA